MRKLAGVVVVLGVLVCAGCAKPVPKYWASAGGSRSDATVMVGYAYNPTTEIPQTNPEQAHEEALKRCRAWGYLEADPFGMVTKRCADMVYGFGGPQCVEMMVTQQYQCLGRGDRATPMEDDTSKAKKIKP